MPPKQKSPQTAEAAPQGPPTQDETTESTIGANGAKTKNAKKVSGKKTTAKKASAKKTSAKKNAKETRAKRKSSKKTGPSVDVDSQSGPTGVPKYPRHDLLKALRIPRAILEQNAGKPCSEEKAAGFAKIGWHGPTKLEMSSSKKYGLLARDGGQVSVTDLAKQILRPKTPEESREGMRKAVLNAPVISEVYSHFRGENLPDAQFLTNTLVDTFYIPAEKVPEFLEIFVQTLKSAELLDETDGRRRVLDTTHAPGSDSDNSATLARLGKRVDIKDDDTCFVMMPFAAPIGGYYAQIYERAILKAGLKPVRADDEIFGPGKIIDQIYRGISEAKVLVAELTTKNPNVFYELGLAHALNKPVVLVSATANDNPFDIRHIRVIFYDTNDPFWGDKLIDKVAENILSALSNPEEALFQTLLKKV